MRTAVQAKRAFLIFLIFPLYSVPPQCTSWLNDMFAHRCLSCTIYCLSHSAHLHRDENVCIYMKQSVVNTFILFGKRRDLVGYVWAKINFKHQAAHAPICHRGWGLTGARANLFTPLTGDIWAMIKINLLAWHQGVTISIQLGPWTNLVCVLLLIKS